MSLQRPGGLVIQLVDEIGNRGALKDTTKFRKNLPRFLRRRLSHKRATVWMEADDASLSKVFENLPDMNTVAPERFDELIGDEFRAGTKTFEADRP